MASTSSITPPTCASDFVYNDSWASNCFAAYPCLCSDQTFLTTAESSIQEYCDAADQQVWAQYFAQNCPGVNIFSTVTTSSNSQGTATAGITSPSVARSTSSSVSPIFTPPNPTTPTASSPNPTLSTSTTSEISSATSNSPVVPTGSTGLSAGDKAGIASAVLAGVGIVTAVLLVIYRRKLEACFHRT
ncbi:hypothetical protein L207DRAFT_582431 [Hyaloscypha variabilis F]|uniref:Extracellular membrane protein CFEM domain-containing protein n=1 Tax=Hyaloscypha variabilis (strain UAMH 11265 / GT02V1 / F) TaxID=1149755 RepID=A0A2J6RNY6_HYAVF|nr:hypothetical protein L207DRAFT_582431 [Hyaloscypha variabilis F]